MFVSKFVKTLSVIAIVCGFAQGSLAAGGGNIGSGGAPLASDLSAELLETLIQNSAKIELSGAVNDGETMASLLGRLLAKRILQPEGASVTLNSISSECEVNSTSVGGSMWTCQLTIADGDYVKTKSGFRGPELESAYTLKFETTVSSKASSEGENQKHKLKGNKVTVYVAG